LSMVMSGWSMVPMGVSRRRAVRVVCIPFKVYGMSAYE
jgi:hypothetical protein